MRQCPNIIYLYFWTIKNFSVNEVKYSKYEHLFRKRDGTRTCISETVTQQGRMKLCETIYLPVFFSRNTQNTYLKLAMSIIDFYLLFCYEIAICSLWYCKKGTLYAYET